MKILATLLKALVVIYVVIFSVLNNTSVEVSYFFNAQPFHLPLFLVIVIAIFCGMVLSAALWYYEKFRTSRVISGLRKELKAAEDEIVRLRNLPLTQSETKKEKPQEEPQKEPETGSSGPNAPVL